MKLTYRRCGNYYLPNIGIPAEDMRPLGNYGRMRMRYHREHRSLLFNQLPLSGKLMKHLHSIDDACQKRMDLLIPQMKATEGITEEQKATDQMEWVRHMNSIHHRIEEMLFNELIMTEELCRRTSRHEPTARACFPKSQIGDTHKETAQAAPSDRCPAPHCSAADVPADRIHLCWIDLGSSQSAHKGIPHRLRCGMDCQRSQRLDLPDS